MNRHHLLHVYTGLRTEIDRLASIRSTDAAGAFTDAFGLNVRSKIVQELSKLLWDSNELDAPHPRDIH